MISERQQEILEFIEAFVDEKGYPPTYEEIRRGLDISTKSLVRHHLDVLETAGCLRRAPNTPRGIQVKERIRSEMFSVPLVGSLAVGDAMNFDDLDSEKAVELTRSLVDDEDDVYALQVRGQAMMDALVNEGDIVVIKSQKFAQNGEMVAVRLLDRNETTLKYFYRDSQRGHVRLQPANPMLGPTFVDPATVEVQGKVVAIIRQVA